MLLIIGLDGADWRILAPWMQDGALPTLAALQARGRWGNLASTIRPESSIAWSTFATGVNPGKHGVFGFMAQRPESYGVKLNTSAAVCAPTFWQLAAEAGKRIALLNIPMTYPPHPIPNGAVVAGMLTPDVHSPFTSPPELRQRLLAAVSDYVINVERTGLKLGDYIRATTRAIHARGRAATWLMQQNAWDVMMVVFSATDRLQHYALHLLFPDHPHHDPDEARRLLPELKAAYQAIDTAIADLLQAAGADATVILLSDHGFAPVSRAFHINTWLRDAGWLKLTGPPRGTAGLWQRLRRHPGLRRLKSSLPEALNVRRPAVFAPWLSNIDWTQTRAFYSPTGGVRFNIRGREPQGIVPKEQVAAMSKTLTRALQDVIDPETGVSPIADIFPREALYHGPWLPLAPDLIVEPLREGADMRWNALICPDFPKTPFSDSMESCGGISGNHAYAGMLLAAGPGIEAGDRGRSGSIASPAIANARLQDLAPTILHLLGLPIPDEMDGEVLSFVGS